MSDDEDIAKIISLAKLFRPERITYLIICVVACLFIMGCAIILIIRDIEEHLHIVVGMFGSTGIITYSIGKLLKMWNDALKCVFGKGV